MNKNHPKFYQQCRVDIENIDKVPFVHILINVKTIFKSLVSNTDTQDICSFKMDRLEYMDSNDRGKKRMAKRIVCRYCDNGKYVFMPLTYNKKGEY